MEKNKIKKIRSLRKKLDKSIQKSGLNSNETRKISNEMDILINEYYSSIEQKEYSEESNMIDYYKQSYKALKKITDEMKKFPSVQEWNKYAKENNYLSNVSLEYISKLRWNYLRVKVLRELNMKI